MTFDELDELERKEVRRLDPREERHLIPEDAVSQLDTGYTGRPEESKDPEKKPMAPLDRSWRRRR